MIGWGEEFPFCICFGAICPGNLLVKSGKTVNTEYLNRIPNHEYLTGANIPKLEPCGSLLDISLTRSRN